MLRQGIDSLNTSGLARFNIVKALRKGSLNLLKSAFDIGNENSHFLNLRVCPRVHCLDHTFSLDECGREFADAILDHQKSSTQAIRMVVLSIEERCATSGFTFSVPVVIVIVIESGSLTWRWTPWYRTGSSPW